MRKRMYKGHSIRRENGSDPNLPIYGKYAAVVDTREVRTCQGGEDDREWMWIGIDGCTGGFYETEEEALAGGIAFAEREGYTADPVRARCDAIATVVQRHNEHCQRSASYTKHYGPAVKTQGPDDAAD